MIRRITLHNFMAHKHTVIEPADGLTVLVGPNNCGKSAVVEALMVLASNSSKDFMIRHDEKECRISVETDEGHQIEWRRTADANSYHINGRSVHRVRSGTVPDDLHNFLKLPEVQGPDGKDAFAVHFGTQKEPIFLLDRSGRHTATFFAASSDASRLLKMQKRHKQKVADSRQNEQVLVERETQLSRSLEILQTLPALLEMLDALELTYEDFQRKEQATKAQEHAIAALNRAFLEVIRSEDRARALEQLQPSPALEDTAPLERLLASLVTRKRACAFESERGRVMGSLNPPPNLQETRSLETTCMRLARQEIAVAKVTHKSRYLSQLTSPPPLEATSSLEKLTECFESQFAHVGYLLARMQISENIPALPTIFDWWALQGTLEKFEIADKRVAALKARILVLDIPGSLELQDTVPLSITVDRLRRAQEDVNEETLKFKRANAALDETRRSFQKWAEAHPLCPTCGARIDPEKFVVEGGHQHAA